jgi:rhamnogalacturonyl hydrolase YesR
LYNGLAGVALVQLFEANKDDKYKKAAVRAANWVITRPVVTNWNYNSFSVFLLAEVYRITGDEKYLESARKIQCGFLGGSLDTGEDAAAARR